jgi:nitrite reductase/ring-hydroxylating ferredoxin subunit
MSNEACPRRRFLQVVAHGGVLAGAASLGVGCGLQLGGTHVAGNVSQLPEGSLQAVSGAPLAVGRDSGGVYAMTLICTHAGCDMSNGISSQVIICPCHRSHFDADGNVTQGPAQTALEHFEVTISAAGVITVDADVTLAQSMRVAVM